MGFLDDLGVLGGDLLGIGGNFSAGGGGGLGALMGGPLGSFVGSAGGALLGGLLGDSKEMGDSSGVPFDYHKTRIERLGKHYNQYILPLLEQNINSADVFLKDERNRIEDWRRSQVGAAEMDLTRSGLMNSTVFGSMKREAEERASRQVGTAEAQAEGMRAAGRSALAAGRQQKAHSQDDILREYIGYRYGGLVRGGGGSSGAAGATVGNLTNAFANLPWGKPWEDWVTAPAA